MPPLVQLGCWLLTDNPNPLYLGIWVGRQQLTQVLDKGSTLTAFLALVSNLTSKTWLKMQGPMLYNILRHQFYMFVIS
jgi:hypothetical protein